MLVAGVAMASVRSPDVPYIDTLDRVSKDRYVAKIDCIGGVDPYVAGTATNMSSDYDGLPPVTSGREVC